MTRPPSPPRNPSGAIHPFVFLLSWVGAALALQWVAAAGAAVLALALHRLTVLREERYLEALSGDEFRRYRLRVRRWV